MEFATHKLSFFAVLKIHLYEDMFVYTGASLTLQSNVTLNSISALTGLFWLVDLIFPYKQLFHRD